MKKTLLMFVLGLFVIVKGAVANEGIVNLRGMGKSACFAVSMYIDGNYRVMMSCRELVTAISPEKNRYIVWYEDTFGKIKNVAEIINGKMNSIVPVRFVKLFVTTEENDFPMKPSADVILSGYVQPIDFGKDIPGGVVLTTVTPTVEVTPTPTPTKEIKATPTARATAVITPRPTSTGQSGLGSALSTIFKVALFGFGLLLVVVGVFSFLQRRRSL